ncbi:unnamed protein product [Caenorhabditis angaria]|uniref:Uncharacterized protein n=1 Tax=Caenorhabditis angaria TaxID=860376 RepID=A0A9P1N982_9PELO|nr:unnamed protein product [Caenorhabditis angaria]
MNMSLAIPQPPATMAFISPVIRNDFNLYERKKPTQRSRTISRTTGSQISPKMSGKESTSLDSLLDKQKQLQIMREKHKQKRNIRRNTLNFRKISVITETDEEDVDEDQANMNMESLRKQFTTQLSSPICTFQPISEEEHPIEISSNSSTSSQSDQKKKKGVMSMLHEWIHNHSLKRRRPKVTQQTPK